MLVPLVFPKPVALPDLISVCKPSPEPFLESTHHSFFKSRLCSLFDMVPHSQIEAALTIISDIGDSDPDPVFQSFVHYLSFDPEPESMPELTSNP